MSPLTLERPSPRTASGDQVVAALGQQLDSLPTGSHYLISDVSWNGYEELLTQRDLHRRGAKVTFAQGKLELMTTTSIHERWKKVLALLIEAFALDHGIPFESTGNLTIARGNLDRGLEPDESYYFQNHALVPRDRSLNFAHDPLPDLVIEIEFSRTVTDRLPVYHALGLPELWVYNGQELQVLIWNDHGYEASHQSVCLPTLPMNLVAELIARVAEQPASVVVNEFRKRLKESP